MKAREIIELPGPDSDPRVEVAAWKDGEIHIECTSDWCGDTESGFGASVGVTLSKDDAKRLIEFLQLKLSS